jgi:hypothetical protein
MTIDVQALRSLLRPAFGDFKDACTNTDIPEFCATLRAPAPPEGGSKRDRLHASFDALKDEDMRTTAELMLARGVHRRVRNAAQELLWAGTPCPEVPKRVRREVAQAMGTVDLYGDARQFDVLIDRLWHMDEPIPDNFGFGQRMMGLRYEIAQHVHRNPGDWSIEQLFDKLGVYTASNARFARFIEGLASGDVRLSEDGQRAFVKCVNQPLQACHAKLREIGSDGGYPVFSLASTHAGKRGAPKNLIFASSVKPDLRFRDALDNDIEIVSNADQVLVYDRPIGAGGLLWRDLQAWWALSQDIDDPKEAKGSLYRRLLSSLPENSPPQRRLFEAYYKTFRKSAPDLPALIPEVWLHWDPKAAEQRGRDALLRFRMDFLLLLPHGTRLVIEVDGQQHYANPDTGKPDPRRYAQMMAADRELRLAGYEVFRFGGAELQTDDDEARAGSFFEALLRRHHLLD